MKTFIKNKKQFISLIVFFVFPTLINSCMDAPVNKAQNSGTAVVSNTPASGTSQNSNALSNTNKNDNESEIEAIVETLDLGDFKQIIKVEKASGASSDKHPVLVYLHGGFWNGGSIEDQAYISDVTGEGIDVVRPSYRLTQPENGTPSITQDATNIYPMQVKDLDCTLRWISASANKMKFDVTKVYLAGYAGGGHLALLFGLNSSGAYANPKCPYASSNLPTVKKVVAIAAPTDLRSSAFSFESEVNSVDYGIYRDAFVKTSKQYEASPIKYALSTSLKDFLLIYNEADEIVKFSTQFTPFYNALKSKNIKVATKIFTSGEHSFADGVTSTTASSEIFDSIVPFINGDPIIDTITLDETGKMIITGANFNSSVKVLVRFQESSAEADKIYSVSSSLASSTVKSVPITTTKAALNSSAAKIELIFSSSDLATMLTSVSSKIIYVSILNNNDAKESIVRDVDISLLSDGGNDDGEDDGDVGTSYSCTGNVPANAKLCANDASDLTKDVAISLVSTCSTAKCEYYCDSGYKKSGSTCITDSVTTCSVGQTETKSCSLPSGNGTGKQTRTCNSTTKKWNSYGVCKVDTCNEGFNANPTQTDCVSGACLGGIPDNATICASDDSGLTQNINISIVTSCTATTKCEYKCNANYTRSSDKKACVLVSSSCTGIVPGAPNSSLCVDDGVSDDLNVSSATARTLVDSCTAEKKCEYTCKTNYLREGNLCIANESACSAGATSSRSCSLSSGNGTGKQVRTCGANLTWGDYDTCTVNQCDVGYIASADGLSCIANQCNGMNQAPLHSAMCPDDDVSVPTNTSISLVDSCANNNNKKCEMYCLSGYTRNENSCIETNVQVDPITAPTLVAGAVSSNALQINWNSISGAAKYMLYNTDSAGNILPPTDGFNAYTNVTVTQTGLSAGTEYCYAIFAYNSSGTISPRSNILCMETSAAVDTVKPSTPTGLTAGATSATSIGINWTASTDNIGVTGYVVCRVAAATTDAQCLTSTDVSTPRNALTAYRDLSANTNYCFKVKAKDAAGNFSDLSSHICAKTLTDPYSAAEAQTYLDNKVKHANALNFNKKINWTKAEVIQGMIAAGFATPADHYNAYTSEGIPYSTPWSITTDTDKDHVYWIRKANSLNTFSYEGSIIWSNPGVKSRVGVTACVHYENYGGKTEQYTNELGQLVTLPNPCDKYTEPAGASCTGLPGFPNATAASGASVTYFRIQASTPTMILCNSVTCTNGTWGPVTELQTARSSCDYQ